jgi:hypothetical protein
MKLSTPLLLLPVASFMVALALSSGGCSATASFGTPQGLLTYSGDVPTDLPQVCANGDFFVVNGDYGSCNSTYYLLCDGSAWNDYTCTDPSGTAGWNHYTVSGTDASTPDAGTDTGPSGGDGGDADAGPSGDDSGDTDAGPSGGDSGDTDAGPSGDDSGSSDAGAADGS